MNSALNKPGVTNNAEDGEAAEFIDTDALGQLPDAYVVGTLLSFMLQTLTITSSQRHSVVQRVRHRSSKRNHID